MTLVLTNFYGIELTDWGANQPGLVMQESITLQNGNAVLNSAHTVPLTIDGDHTAFLKVNLAGTTSASKSINMGYISGKNYIARSSLTSSSDGDLSVSTDQHMQVGLVVEEL